MDPSFLHVCDSCTYSVEIFFFLGGQGWILKWLPTQFLPVQRTKLPKEHALWMAPLFLSYLLFLLLRFLLRLTKLTKKLYYHGALSPASVCTIGTDTSAKAKTKQNLCFFLVSSVSFAYLVQVIRFPLCAPAQFYPLKPGFLPFGRGRRHVKEQVKLGGINI